MQLISIDERAIDDVNDDNDNGTSDALDDVIGKMYGNARTRVDEVRVHTRLAERAA